MLGGIVYGGRITDTADMHVLVALLRRFLRPELMDDKFSFASDQVYRRPPVGNLQSYRYLPVHFSLLQESTASLPIGVLQCMYISMVCTRGILLHSLT